MKIATYNVNGLRQHVSPYGSLLKLLNALDTDIICFQETKLSRQDLSVELTFAERYEGFLSCTRSNSRDRFAYSEKRWELLLNQGRRVIVVGDLNIASAAIDRCDAEPGFEKNMFRKWLRSLLRDSGGPFFDVFQSKHPDRREACTCFSPKVGAEEFNYGSRIDHILIAGSCLHEHDLEAHNCLDCHDEECDILILFKRGKPESTTTWQGGRIVKLDRSGHVPVYAVLSNMPNLSVHNSPQLAVRYIPEVRGCQQIMGEEPGFQTKIELPIPFLKLN